MPAATAMLADSGEFREPPWNAPLDAADALRRIPADATISGMFLNALVQEAARRAYRLPSAAERYVSFRFYPLVDHCRLLIETCQARFPELSLRQGLRKLGRGAPSALLSSMLGKVVLGSAQGVHAIVRAMADAYPINAKPSRVSVVGEAADSVIVRLEEIHYFLDSHHVGAFEGVLRFAGVPGTVRIRSYSATKADLLLEWRGGT